MSLCTCKDMFICMLDLACFTDHAIILFHFKRSDCETLKHYKTNHPVVICLKYRNDPPNGNNMVFFWRIEVMAAVNAGDAAQVAELLESANKHGSLDFTGHLYTPLTQAVHRKNRDMVEQLLCAGARVDFYDDWGRTPLMEAAWHPDKDICHVLLRHGANVNAMHEQHKWQALHHSIMSNDVQVASLLLENGAELYDLENLNDQHDDSPFHFAIILKSPHFLQLLLHYADRKKKHVSLEILCNKAIQYDSEKCAIFTLQQGYYPRWSADFSSNRSCFHEAAHRGLIKLMSFMLEFNPHFMQEDWLVQKDFPAGLHEHSDFVLWLADQRKYPSSLVKLCRSRILAQLDTYYTRKVAELPLPNTLKTFLKNVESTYVQA